MMMGAGNKAVGEQQKGRKHSFREMKWAICPGLLLGPPSLLSALIFMWPFLLYSENQTPGVSPDCLGLFCPCL